MKKQVHCISAADIHGNKLQYEKLRTVVTELGVSYVFLCGDLLPKDGGLWYLENKVRTIELQASFIRNYFLDYLRELGKKTTIYAVFGNDDFKSNYHLVKKANIPNVYFLCNEIMPLTIAKQDFYVAGYPYIGPTPFMNKDWEKWDSLVDTLPHKIYRADGYVSKNGKHFPIDHINTASTIASDLDKLAKLSDPHKTVYLFHEAPYNTPLDMIGQDNKYIKNDELHIGSFAIRDFIEDKQPLITMHGHIHETYEQSGDFKWQVNSSISVTAANDFTSSMLSYVLFTLPDPSNAVRISF